MREKYKVLVNSKAEARMYRKALLAIGEKVFKPFFKEGHNIIAYSSSFGWRCSSGGDLLETITFKELIKLLVNEEVKPSKEELLKIAQEKYPKGTRFKQMGSGETIVSTGDFELVDANTYFFIKNGSGDFVYYSDYNKSEWAEIVKTPLITTVDGVDLFEGDSYHYCHSRADKWFYLGFHNSLRKIDLEVTNPEIAKAFHSKQAALDWCNE